MRIKIAILENDKNYLNRIVSVFSTKYSDKFQIFSFTNAELAIETVVKEKVDILIADDSFNVNPEMIPERCSLAYFVNSVDVETVNNQKAICKFQKAELIYKQILSIYSENAGSLSGLKLSDDCKITIFSSPCGGVGTSTVAAAYALFLAQRGRKTLFLTYDSFGSTDLFFTGDGQSTISDLIFALKSKKGNLAMKMESYVKRDPSNVCFFSKAKYTLDMLELNNDEKLFLLEELKLLGSYDDIVLDLSFGLDKDHLAFYKKAHDIIMVSDGSELANENIANAYEALIMLDNNMDVSIANRFSLLYNRFSSKTGKLLDCQDLKNIGGAPVYAQATVRQIMEQLSQSDVFSKIF